MDIANDSVFKQNFSLFLFKAFRPASLKSILKSRSLLLANCYRCQTLTTVNLDFAIE